MIIVEVNTNLSKAKITEEYCTGLIETISTCLNKPKGYCAVHILPGNTL